jgi:putative Ca2+/H+ antiporter (TMEM165/GDT1 family)
VTHRRVIVTAFVVIFLAEWGDLTQILTANLAAHYHSALSVGVGSTLALWAVAGLAVVGGQSLLRYVNVRTVRRITALLLVILSVVAAWSAIRG